MNFRADAMQQSAQNSAKITSAKAEEILNSLNNAIEKSKSVDQIKTLASKLTSDLTLSVLSLITETFPATFCIVEESCPCKP